MKSHEMIDLIYQMYPNAGCELEYFSPFSFLCAVILSAQTTDKRVNEVTKILFSKYNNLEELSKADINVVMNILRPIGTFRKKAQNVVAISKSLLNVDGIVPNDREFLEELPGVGRKTTNVVLSILYNENCIAVDTHVLRVSKRLGLASLNDDVRKVEQKLINKVFY